MKMSDVLSNKSETKRETLDVLSNKRETSDVLSDKRETLDVLSNKRQTLKLKFFSCLISYFIFEIYNLLYVK